jgi:DNA-binding NarL/FixJ family response regulator
MIPISKRDVSPTPYGGMHRARDALHNARMPAMPRPKALRVVLADDHPVYRQGLARLLEKSGIEVVAQAGNGLAALEAVEDAAPDVVVIDLSMAGLNSAEVMHRLTACPPASKVLVISVSAEEDDVTEAILAGASGYVLKDGPVEEVVAGIKAAAAGEALVSPRIATMLLRNVRNRRRAKPQGPPSSLSARELKLLELVAEGKSNRDIAAALVIAHSTIRDDVASILVKRQLENRVGTVNDRARLAG